VSVWLFGDMVGLILLVVFVMVLWVLVSMVMCISGVVLFDRLVVMICVLLGS